MRLALSFSLLVTLTTSAAAAQCLEQHGPGSVSAPTVTVGQPGPPGSGLEGATMTAGSKGSPSAQACCNEQASTPEVVTSLQRALPAEQAVVLLARMELFPADVGHGSPGLFDPALDKRDHLTPSLTGLSISRR